MNKQSHYLILCQKGTELVQNIRTEDELSRFIRARVDQTPEIKILAIIKLPIEITSL